MEGAHTEERRPTSAVVTRFEPGQMVIWIYRSQIPPHWIYQVAAEVVHGGSFRARIRVHDSAGNLLLRWVKPERLRQIQANETPQLYPAQPTSQR